MLEFVSFPCTCGKEFISKQLLNVHIARAHSGEKTKPIEVKCDLCDFKSVTVNISNPRFMLDNHMKKVHFKDKELQCKICDLFFGSKAALNQHARSHQQAKLLCPFCQKFLKKKQTLRNHIRQHAKANPSLNAKAQELLSQLYSRWSLLNVNDKAKEYPIHCNSMFCFISFRNMSAEDSLDIAAFTNLKRH